MNENSVTLERWNDPALIARIKARQERAQRNRDWLDAHLAELLPQARWKLVAVAGQEAFIAETTEEAEAKARAAHPEDDGLVIRVVPFDHQISPGENPVTMEIETDPEELARSYAIHQRAVRNSDWLHSHWAEILPQVRGKFVAVAGQEAFIADTHAEAWARARTAHPDDDGAISQYVRSSRGPRIYAHRRRMAGR
jgi:hypothetical protein